MILLLKHGVLAPSAARNLLKIRDRADFHERFLRPLFRSGMIEQTIPEKATSRFQKYRLSAVGRALAKKLSDKGAGQGSSQGTKLVPSPTPQGTTPESSPESSLESLSAGARSVLEMIKADDRLKTQMMADRLGVSKRMVLKYIKELSVIGLYFEGPSKRGRWVFDTAKKGGGK